ncbi:MAG: glycosyltransferase [bacterium]|nr:glycosyltransferase [bacterium]
MMNNKEKPAVSIIVTIYNQENYLQECLESIINQTLKEIEIICINGGSTDDSGRILEEYAKKDSRIKVITGENLGQAHNTNVGIKAATGKYLGCVDSDDYIDSYMCEILYNQAEEKQLDVVKYNYFYFKDDPSGKVRRIYNMRQIIQSKYYNVVSNIEKDKYFLSMCMPVWSGLYNREFIINNNIWLNESKETSFVDNGFTFQVLILAKRMCYLNRALYFYRTDNKNSVSREKEPYRKLRCEYDYIRKFLEKDEERFHTYINMYHFYKYINYLYVYSITPSEEKQKVIQQMAVEFHEAIEKKEIDPTTYFTTEHWKDYQQVASLAK